MDFDMYTMERRIAMTLPVQANLNTYIGSTRLGTFTNKPLIHTFSRFYYRTAEKFMYSL